MAERDFDEWLKTFRPSIAEYTYYTDFKKVVENAKRYKVELNAMNSLIGEKDIENRFLELIKDYPKVLRVVPLLLAKRESEIFAMDDEGSFDYNFSEPNQSPEQYAAFMRKTGLFELISEHIINNLYDYVLGVETGLDSNARKNRGGHQMEDLVEKYIRKTGMIYHKEMYASDIEEKFNLDLSRISNNGKAEKRFDFVIESRSCIIAIETNFYSGGGSKLNETARSYKMLTEESKNIEGFRFMWITDGNGWTSAKRNLEETFDVLEDLYNINDLENGVLNRFKWTQDSNLTY